MDQSSKDQGKLAKAEESESKRPGIPPGRSPAAAGRRQRADDCQGPPGRQFISWKLSNLAV